MIICKDCTPYVMLVGEHESMAVIVLVLVMIRMMIFIFQEAVII